MKKVRPKILVKIAVLVFWGGLLVFSAQDLYRYLARAQRVNQEFVQFYSPQLNIKLIKNAAKALR